MKRARWGKIRVWLTISLLGVAGVLIVLNVALARAGLSTRKALVKELEQRFHADVELRGLQLRILPRPKASGEGVSIRRPEDGAAPFLAIRKLTAASGIFHLLHFPPHVQHVQLEGLEIHIPPRRQKDKAEQKQPQKRAQTLRFVMDEVIADGTMLQTTPKDPGKEPLTWDIRKLTLYDAGVDRPMTFHATLHNPKPPGDIRTTGSFGPWAADDPGDTPVSGDYSFENADLSVFKGIAGILSSHGKYGGTLDHIDVHGKADVPQFALKSGGHALPLRTEFHSIVDGTNGDTELQPVNAMLADTPIVARGAVQGTPGVKGKEVILDAVIDNGKLEDVLRLAVDGEPPLTGIVSVKTKIDIPQGQDEVVDKLRLDGSFSVRSARFTSFNIEQKITSLSRRARGEPKKKGPGSVLSNFHGRFRLRDGLMKFSTLSFTVPGARLDLSGSFGLRKQSIDFEGTIRMEAKISQTMTGFKALLLKPVDPFFRKNGETVIPIKIGGTRDHPSFGLRF